MKVICSKLPSKGFGCTLDILDIKPLTYQEVTKYCSQGSSGELDDFIWDFENLIMTLEDWEKLSSFDCYALFAYRKMLSIDLKGSFKLFDGTQFTLKDVDFTDVSGMPINLESITINNKEYKPCLKSMDSFYKTLKIFQHKTKNLKFPVVASYLGEDNPDVILNLTNGDIKICEDLYVQLMSQPKVKIGGAEAIIFGKASDLFQNIIELSDSSKANFRFQKIHEL